MVVVLSSRRTKVELCYTFFLNLKAMTNYSICKENDSKQSSVKKSNENKTQTNTVKDELKIN